MKTSLFFLLGFFLSFAVSAPATADPINAVVGDASWHGLQTGDSATADEQTRIRTHLLWVETSLRNTDVSDLPAVVARRRLILLDQLADYRRAGEFPQHELAGEGRQPRWVDHQGRACAVGHLVAVSGHQELFDHVAEKHEYDFVPDIDIPQLLEWADQHGFTERELAMIQPAYRHGGVTIPTPWEQERIRQEEERRRKVPRPLTRAKLESFASAAVSDRELKRACLKRNTGRWRVLSSVVVDSDVNAAITTNVTSADGTPSSSKVRKCFETGLERRIQKSLETVNFTVEESISLNHASEILVPGGVEIESEFLKRNAFQSHRGDPRAALAKCFEKSAASGSSAVIPLQVSSWNGQVVLRWPEIRKSDDIEYRRFGWCLQDVLTYGSVKPYGIWDHTFSVRIESDGSISVI